MSSFKKLLYDKVVDTLNNQTTAGLIFDGGYEYVIYNGIPYVIDQSTTSLFDYSREEIIVVTEEYNQETPSVNASDRSDYVVQYQIMFRLQHLDNVVTSLTEFRDYFFTNKQFTLGDYTVAIKTVRGNKQSSVMVEGGNVYGRYKIDVYCTAIKNGYIWKDTDKIEMKLTTESTYQNMALVEDLFGTSYNAMYTNKTKISKAEATTATINPKLRYYYNSTALDKEIYKAIKNRPTDTTNQRLIVDVKETFDGMTFTYKALITSGARTAKPNEPIILEIDWAEYNE